MSEPLLVGDIGGTNVRFAVAQKSVSGIHQLAHIWREPSSRFSSFSDALQNFFTDSGLAVRPNNAVFAFAGPVDFNVVKLTNKSWTMQRKDLIKKFGFEDLVFMNDFAAMARSVPELGVKAFLNLQTGQRTPNMNTRTMAVAGAGTGLGQAILINHKRNGWSVLPTEGGHQPFAPTTDFEAGVLEELRHRIGYVSYENICSGNGLELLYRLMADMKDLPIENLTAREITNIASKDDPIAEASCEFAANALMSFIGNSVLSSGAWDGAVIAGGVSKHLSKYLRRPQAIECFLGKGKMRARMERVPLRLLTDPTAPLIGAASAGE